VRRVLALVLTSLLVAVAAACSSGSPKPAPTGIDLVSVSGSVGKKPKVSFAKPFKTSKTESKVIKPGKGAKITEGQQVVVDYVGVNGRNKKEFDSSWKNGQPVTFPIGTGNLIKGWDEGLVGVPVGSRVQLDIPAEQAYGEKTTGGQPAGDLRFVVDILKAS
jgi:peptidylprolyl isomerase